MDVSEHIKQLPQALQLSVQQQWQSFIETGIETGVDVSDLPDEINETLSKVWACSDFVMQACVRHPDVFFELMQSGDLQRNYDDEKYNQSVISKFKQGDEEALKKHLRVFRRREMLRIIWRDIAGWADLKETTTNLSHMAEACIDFSLSTLYDWHCQQFGTPCNSEGEAQKMSIIGMGKLGAWELNLSSDIDLIFCFSEDGLVQGGRGEETNSQFFIRLGKKLVQSLDDKTADGFVFRTDMRLRPFGEGGALALSFSAMEHYYQIHGREWERYAMIKARIVGGDREAGQTLMNMLRPFVYRRYMDYGAYDALREMKSMIDKQVKRKSMANNIKLGRGGIREVEFIAQVFQLIRGGRERKLQARKVLRVLRYLAAQDTLPDYVVEQLIESYTFLRNTEHRLQGYRDQQTHNLPTDEEGQLRLAFSMGFIGWDDFYSELERYRQQVQDHFEQVFEAPQTDHDKGENLFEDLWNQVLDDDTASELLSTQGYQTPEKIIKQLIQLRNSRTYSGLSAKGKERLDDLMPLMLGALGQAHHQSQNIDITFERVLDLVTHIARRSVYVALLVETPLALSQLVRLCSASPWIARFLKQYPLLLDELIDVRTLYAPPDKESLSSELQQRMLSIPEEDEEQRMDALRHFKHTNMLRVAAADVMGALPLMKVSDHLTWIAEVVLDEALEQAWQYMLEKHGRPICRVDEKNEGTICDKGFAIIGYGKLGGFELGYGSDLDMVFLHAGEDPNLMTQGDKPITVSVFFARLGQRLIHLLTAHTSAGVLYEADMRLRPDGASGMLVSNLSAFEGYQNKKAWLWEHQALVRSRVVAGDLMIAERFVEIRKTVLAQKRQKAQLQHDVLEMREKMRKELNKPSAGQFSLKQGAGGIVDIEFLVQYAVLAYSYQYPVLLEWTDNIRLLQVLGEEGLMSKQESDALCEAYRIFRARLHQMALQEIKAEVPAEEYTEQRERVKQLWQQWIEG